MPPAVATVLFAGGILLLFWLDRGQKREVSPALWIPTAWLLIAGSRMLSEWQAASGKESPDQYFDGSPIDRLVLTGLLAAGLAVLLARGRESQAFVRRNAPLLLFFLYCGASVLWSDYPDVAFKRWTKALGDVVMVMVVLTDADPILATKRLLTRAAFLLIPASVLLIKYYPDLGRGYEPWTWMPYYGGVATGKNSLGYVCLVFGLGTVWRFLGTFAENDPLRRRRSQIAHGVVLAMTMWLSWQADSATSLACFLLGSALLVVASTPGFARTRTAPHLVMGAVVCVAFTIVFLNADAALVQAMGRDSTLTGRTELWSTLGRMVVDPLFGAGYESFWLGDRVVKLWSVYWWHPRQAHNGYLEVFLNLGSLGVALVGFVVAWGYRNIAAAFARDPDAARMRLAFLVVALAYNVTEAAFKMMHPVWIALLFAVAVPIPPRIPSR